MTCLTGDCNPFVFYREFCKKQLVYQDILKEEFRLSNLYLHALKEGAGIIRTPTHYCSKSHLEKSGDYERMENIINVCISTAKNAMKQVNANTLLAGCISNIHQAHQKTNTEIVDELNESIIYISDFGVDIMVIEGIDDWETFEVTVGICRKLAGCPIAPFFKTSNINIALVHEYAKLCDEFSVELMGFEINSVQELEALQRVKIDSGTPIGLILSGGNDPTDLPIDTYLNLLEKIKPTVLLGGDGLSRKDWLTLNMPAKDGVPPL